MADEGIRQERTRNLIALAILLFGVVLGQSYFHTLWTLDQDGISRLNQKLPYWDFSNLWAGGRMALLGHVDWLFDVETYRQQLRLLFTPVLQDQEWSYPPSLLLIGVPLSTLPVFVAYVVWTLGTIAALFFAIRPLRLSWPVELALLVSPAVMINALIGQNGALTAALLIAGLWNAPKRPLLAGLFFGLLTMKPHLGLLVPAALLAARNWRAIVYSGLSTLLLVLVTGLIFGMDVWEGFRTVTTPLMAAIMEAPYPQPYHANAMTIFVLARFLQLPLAVAYGIQAVFTLAALCTTYWLWRPRTVIDPARRLAITLLLVLIATPYGYSYDAVPLVLATAWGFLHERRIPLFVHGFVWIFPLFVHVLNLQGLGIAILVPLAYALLNLQLVYRDQQAQMSNPTSELA